jgi:hypothetical protein
MTDKFLLLTMVAIFAWPVNFAFAGGADPVEEEQIVIALSTDDFELAETDISGLAVGDAQTFMTDSGKQIDLLRTEEGVEIYVDGELIDAGLHGEHDLHEGHRVVHKHVEVICDTDEECEETVWISDDEDFDGAGMHHEVEHEKIIVIKRDKETD